MKEEYISFETAKLAFDKDFKGVWCKQSYDYNGVFYKNNLPSNNIDNADYCIAAPTQSLLARWLREEFNKYARVIVTGKQIGRASCRERVLRLV